MADAMLRIAGERIVTPACGLVRNDSEDLPSALKIDALRNEKYVIARERSDRGNPFPSIRKDANARRAFHLHS